MLAGHRGPEGGEEVASQHGPGRLKIDQDSTALLCCGCTMRFLIETAKGWFRTAFQRVRGMVRHRSFGAWVLLALGAGWWLADVFSRIEYILTKLAATKPVVAIVWAGLKSVPPIIYQSVFFLGGLVWLYWIHRHPRPAPFAGDSMAIEVKPTPPTPTPAAPLATEQMEGGGSTTEARQFAERVLASERPADVTSKPAMPTTPQAIFLFDLCWDIQPDMWKPDYRRIPDPAGATLDRVIIGPRCPKCTRSLKAKDPNVREWLVGGPIYRIENPCPRCGRTAKEYGGTFVDLQREVYKEADRLISRGERFPSGLCTGAQ